MYIYIYIYIYLFRVLKDMWSLGALLILSHFGGPASTTLVMLVSDSATSNLQ